MRIKIDDRYLIETDRLNYILKERSISDKTGKQTVRNIGYYSSMTMLAKRYLEERQKAIGDDLEVDLEHYANLIEDSNQKAVSILYDILRAYPMKG